MGAPNFICRSSAPCSPIWRPSCVLWKEIKAGRLIYLEIAHNSSGCSGRKPRLSTPSPPRSAALFISSALELGFFVAIIISGGSEATGKGTRKAYNFMIYGPDPGAPALFDRLRPEQNGFVRVRVSLQNRHGVYRKKMISKYVCSAFRTPSSRIE